MTPVLGIIASSNQQGRGVAVGSYDALATVTVPSGGVASITFAGIPSGYRHLQIRAIAKNTLSNTYTANFYMRFNGDSGNNYTNHAIYGTGSSVVPNIPSGANPVFAIWGLSGSTQFGAHIIDIVDYASTNKFKTVRTLFGTDNVSAGYVGLESGAWLSNNAVTSIFFSMGDGTQTIAQYSQFALYGVK